MRTRSAQLFSWDSDPEARLRTACKKFGKVQKITDDAVAKVTADGDYKGPADFGTL